LVACSAVGVYFKLNANLTSEPLQVLGVRPAATAANAEGHHPMNILVLGSQTRDGQIGHFGGTNGTDISDTAMLVHLAADRERAFVISIPRDLVVARPDCAAHNNPHRIIPGDTAAIFDAAMSLGGPSCAVATVENFAHLRIDHFIRVDFNGFRRMVNAIGGVEVCVPPPGIHDRRSRLDIAPGKHVIRDQEALAFVRDRHGVGDGGDLGRIRMQQAFVSSLIQKMKSTDVLANPVTSYRLANTATSALTVDPALASIRKLLGLGEQLRDLTPADITFVTAPNTTDEVEKNRLVPEQPQFDALFGLLRSDRALPPPAAVVYSAASTGRVPGAEAVIVHVLDATGAPGAAKKAGDRLRALGFRVAVGHRGPAQAHTTISTVPGSDLLGPLVKPTPSRVAPPMGFSGVTLTLGKDFRSIATPQKAPGVPGAQPGATAAVPAVSVATVQTRTADTDICQGLPAPRRFARHHTEPPAPAGPAGANRVPDPSGSDQSDRTAVVQAARQSPS
jgi:LCP family protein required for cell wall assembly